MKGHFLNAMALAAVAGALNALGPRDALAARRGVVPTIGFTLPKAPPRKRKGYYDANGAREVARRRRQIAAGTLRVTG